MKVSLLSLGCPRNLVDSELILGSLKEDGHKIVDIEDRADIAIVNTCAFIESARRESIDAILEASRLKKKGRIRYLVVAGCLAQGYHRELRSELKEVDAFLGTSDLGRINELLGALRRKKGASIVSKIPDHLPGADAHRYALTPGHYAYLKISEGCGNLCSYCIISKLRGPFRSRPMGDILREAGELADRMRAKEIDIIGQDTTMYGSDIYGESCLAELLRRLAAMKTSVRWIRLLYTHPAHYTDALIETMADEEKICKYLDLPIQHISDRILDRMNRKVTKTGIIDLIDRLRGRIKGLAIRTSLIVGFPGETDRDFRELLEFVRETKFERLGAFIYSKEAGTRAGGFKDQVPDEVKNSRLDELMKLQRSVSEEVNKKFLGSQVDVLIDEACEDDPGQFLGRTQADAPEVDGIVYVRGKGLKVGSFRRVRIIDTLEYDLVGEADGAS